MRKVLITVAMMMFVSASTIKAQSGNPSGEAIQIPLTWSEVPPIYSNPQKPKAPMLMPTVYRDDHALYVDDRLADYTLELYQGGEVVYQHYILYGESSIILPSTLSGEYVIRFVNDEGNAYVGEIAL